MWITRADGRAHQRGRRCASGRGARATFSPMSARLRPSSRGAGGSRSRAFKDGGRWKGGALAEGNRGSPGWSFAGEGSAGVEGDGSGRSFCRSVARRAPPLLPPTHHRAAVAAPDGVGTTIGGGPIIWPAPVSLPARGGLRQLEERIGPEIRRTGLTSRPHPPYGRTEPTVSPLHGEPFASARGIGSNRTTRISSSYRRSIGPKDDTAGCLTQKYEPRSS